MFICLILAALLFSCQLTPTDSADTHITKGETGIMRLRIQRQPLGKLGSASLASQVDIQQIQVYVIIPEQPAITQTFPMDDSEISIAKIPPSDNIVVEVELMDGANIPVYSGMTSGISVAGGKTVSVDIQCSPLFSSLLANFPLGKNNPLHISRGRLQLENRNHSYVDTADIFDDFAQLEIPIIAGGENYHALIQFWDSSETLIFQSGLHDSLFIPLGEAVYFESKLEMVTASMDMEITLNASAEATLHLAHPLSTRRTPGPGDIIFSEFNPEPTEALGGAEGEWIEVFNRTQDTLNLGGCSIRRSRNSSSLSTYFEIPEDVLISPSDALVFGQREALYKDIEFEFKMVGTKQSLLFFCTPEVEDILIDSLSYTTEYNPVDSIFNQKGWVSSKRVTDLGAANTAEYWCLSDVTNNDSTHVALGGSVLSQCL